MAHAKTRRDPATCDALTVRQLKEIIAGCDDDAIVITNDGKEYTALDIDSVSPEVLEEFDSPVSDVTGTDAVKYEGPVLMITIYT